MTTALDDWTVVGSKGKPRKNTHQQQQHTSQAGICSTQQAPTVTTQAHSAAISSTLPGWDTTSTSAGGFTYSSTSSRSSSSSRRRQQQQQQHGSSSPEQQVQRLQQQIQAAAQELKQAGVYQALLAAMRAVAVGQSLPIEQQPQEGEQQPAQQQHLGDQQQQHLDEHQQQQQEQQQQQLDQQQQQQWDWSSVQQLVVYGLGSPEDSKVSRHQLAMVLLLQELLPGLQQQPQLYDPAFTPLDQLLLQSLGLAVVPVNEEGRRCVQQGQQMLQTLFFLPHCEGVLCDNLLASNWSHQQLPCLAILGNSFASYCERWSGPPSMRPKTPRPARLLQCVEEGLVCEVAVPDRKYPVASAFNDMSLHTFAAAAARPGLFAEGN